VALEACLGVLGSDLSPEMQARIKKRVKIIQPISNTWEAEALGEHTGAELHVCLHGMCAAPGAQQRSCVLLWLLPQACCLRLHSH
jgi:hypothetical protein